MEKGERGVQGARAGAVAGTGCHRSYQVRRIRRPCAVFGVEKYLCCLAEQQKEEEERGRGRCRGRGCRAGSVKLCNIRPGRTQIVSDREHTHFWTCFILFADEWERGRGQLPV